MQYAKLLFSALFLGILLQVQAQDEPNAIDKYFKQYVDDDRFTVVYISPKLFQMLGKLEVNGLDLEGDEEAAAILDIAKDMKGLRILVTDITPDKFYQEAKARINTKEYEILMTVKERDGDNVDFLVKEEGDRIQELLLLAGGDEFVLLSFVGSLQLEKISKLGKAMEKN